jgi:hypothetical protein
MGGVDGLGSVKLRADCIAICTITWQAMLALAARSRAQSDKKGLTHDHHLQRQRVSEVTFPGRSLEIWDLEILSKGS